MATREKNKRSQDEKLVQLFLETRARNLHEIVILPAIKIVMKKIVSMLENKKNLGKVINGTLNGIEISVISSLMGCPNMAIIVESLKRCRTKVIIRVDICGGIEVEENSVSIGDILIPNLAYCGDGTCPQYIAKHSDNLQQLRSITNPNPKISRIKSGNQNVYLSEPDEQLKMLLYNYGESLYPEKIKKVDFWTTDAIFCENDDFITALRSIGVQGIDMENSILFLLGRLYNIKTASILSVSDLPGNETGDFSKEKYLFQDLNKGIDDTLTILCNSLPKISLMINDVA